MGDLLLDLLGLMRGHFAKGLTADGPTSAETARVLSLLPDNPAAPTAPLPPCRHPVAGAVGPAMREGDLAWAKILTPLAPVLPWRFTYAPRPDAPGLQDRMAWAEIVGPAAPIRSDRVGFGLTFISRDTDYLPHRHPAVELYNIVAGTALWTLEGSSSLRRPGAFVLHPSSAIHAMRTSREATLAIYSWTGDVTSPTVYV